MKKFLNSKYGEAIVLIAASVLNLICTFMYYSFNLTEKYGNGGATSLWTATVLYTKEYEITGASTFFIIGFCVGLALLIASAVLMLLKRKKILFYFSVPYNFLLSAVMLCLKLITRVFSSAAIAFMVISMVFSSATAAFLIVRRNSNKTEEEPVQPQEALPKHSKLFKIIMLVCECLATALMFSVLFVPVYTDTNAYILIKTLTETTYPLYLHIAFMVAFIACFAGLMCFISTLSYFKHDKAFASKSKSYMFGTTAFTLTFFVLGYSLTFYNNLIEANSYTASTVSYIPFILSAVVLIVYSVFLGKINSYVENLKLPANSAKLKIEPLIYVILLTLVTLSSLAFNIVSVKLNISGIWQSEIKLSGYKLMTAYPELESGYQVLAFAMVAMFAISGAMLIVSVVSLFAKNKDYYKVIKTSAIANVVFVALLGLFGIYFQIAQKINEENLLSLFEYFNLSHLISYEYKVSSQAIYLLIVSLIILVIMIVRKQFNLTVEEPLKVEVSSSDELSQIAATDAALPQGGYEPLSPLNFDACPAFTELDQKEEQFRAELETRRANLFTNLTLPNLVRFVVDYARESRLHLSYSSEDIATFVAGLGASRLSILQGMSGTGKTSLPKIFTEAIMGNCEIVEVESSWRDKNELLGYYNEFSKCYTPKKFTQCLYKAKLNSEVLTFIVLDEMNLSRIEYYFSDFLSLMEHEEDKREIKLLNIKLSRKENGEDIYYRALSDGHTIKIPSNVWFIGTANRDESTFAISDKVYDRAQTMNFNKRAPKIHSFSEPIPQRFASYEMIKQLFETARSNGSFDAEENATVRKVEKLLAPYNISFGNRILKQMEDFVKIYCACFGDKDAVLKEAVEKILLSKVVSKLENKVVENKEALAVEFDRIGLAACSEFIRKLNED